MGRPTLLCFLFPPRLAETVFSDVVSQEAASSTRSSFKCLDLFSLPKAPKVRCLTQSACAVSLPGAVGTECPSFVLIPSMVCPTAVISACAEELLRRCIMRKRSFIVLLMPILAVLWVLGWFLSGNGGRELRGDRAKMATESVTIVHVASTGSVFASDNHLIIEDKRCGHTVSM